jgi:alkylation response protein AidB-like acyl-CoA dehydrogenase
MARSEEKIMQTIDVPYGIPAHEAVWLDRVRELAEVFRERAAAYDESGELPVENLRALHAEGIDTLFLPTELGGQGIGHQTFGEIVRTLSEADPATACVWLMHVGAAVALAQRTVATLGTFYADALFAGKRFANALTEPAGGGSAFLLPQQTALPVPGGYRLDGAKRFVSGCEIADYFLVSALVDGTPAFFGLAPDATVSFTPIWDTLGLRASRSQLIAFNGTLLRAEHRTETPQRGDLNPIGVGLALLSIGIADAALGALIQHARTRIVAVAGKPLSDMQWVQFAVAEKQSALEAARAYTRQTLWQLDNGTAEPLAILRTKLLANEIARDIAQLGINIGGATGFLRSSPIQRHFRDAQAGGLMAYSIETSKAFIGEDVLGAAHSVPTV